MAGTGARRAVVAAVFLMFLGGCTGAGSEPPLYRVPTSPPPVVEPVELGVLGTKPCAALTKEQRDDAFLEDEGREGVNDDGRLSCRWLHRSDHLVEYLLIPYPDKPIVPELYAGRPPEPDPTFIAYRVFNRFPAVQTTDAEKTSCTLTVAVSERQSFQVREVPERGFTADCFVPPRIAQQVLVTLGA